jgi:uncharacterized protein
VVGLLDVNVLVALVIPEHEHHNLALNWYTTEAVEHDWSTCAVTELGVMRVCAQLRGGSWPPERTADQLLLLTVDGRNHAFWPDAISPAVMAEVRYLLGLARRNGGRVITFDRHLGAAGDADMVCLLSSGE